MMHRRPDRSAQPSPTQLCTTFPLIVVLPKRDETAASASILVSTSRTRSTPLLSTSGTRLHPPARVPSTAPAPTDLSPRPRHRELRENSTVSTSAQCPRRKHATRNPTDRHYTQPTHQPGHPSSTSPSQRCLSSPTLPSAVQPVPAGTEHTTQPAARPLSPIRPSTQHTRKGRNVTRHGPLLCLCRPRLPSLTLPATSALPPSSD